MGLLGVRPLGIKEETGNGGRVLKYKEEINIKLFLSKAKCQGNRDFLAGEEQEVLCEVMEADVWNTGWRRAL